MSGKRMLHDRICESEKSTSLVPKRNACTLACSHIWTTTEIILLIQVGADGVLPPQEKWNNHTINVWLDRIVEVGLAAYYERQGDKFVHFGRFEDFQNSTTAMHSIRNSPMTGVVIRA